MARALRLAPWIAMLAVAGLARAGRCPNVMLVLDRSGSMVADPEGNLQPWGPSKWEILQDAVQQIVGAYGDQVPFGLEMFSSNGPTEAQCYDDTRITVEPAHGTAAL